eukprot:5693668-Heterocapsa_arctica.AAC.1
MRRAARAARQTARACRETWLAIADRLQTEEPSASGSTWARARPNKSRPARSATRAGTSAAGGSSSSPA